LSLLQRIADGWRDWIRAYRAIPAARAIDTAIALRDSGQKVDARERAAAVVAELIPQQALGSEPYRAGLLLVSSCLVEQLSDELGVQGLPRTTLRKVIDVCDAVGTLPPQYRNQLSWLRSRLPR
jgi:hypothetical protein